MEPQTMSTEEMLAMLSDEDDMYHDSKNSKSKLQGQGMYSHSFSDTNFQLAIVGDEECFQRKDNILEYLHQKDLLSKVDIAEIYMKNAMTVLLAVEEDVPESQVE